MSEAGPNDANEKLDDAHKCDDGCEHEEDQIAYGLTVYVTTNGRHGVEPIGGAEIMDIMALLYRALKGAESQFQALHNIEVQAMMRKQAQENQSKIVAPKPGIKVVK